MEKIHVTERILNLSLEIISLLTGETFTAAKSSDLIAIMAPSHHFALPKRPNKKKLLDLTNKMIELLTIQSGNLNKCSGVKEEVKEEHGDGGVMEERWYLEGHEEVYKEAMFEDQPKGGCEKKPPPDICLPPQDPCVCTQEAPHHDQGEGRTGTTAEAQERAETFMRSGHWSAEKVRIMVTIKDEPEQMCMRAGLQFRLEAGGAETMKMEECSTDVSSEQGHRMERNLEEHQRLSPGPRMQGGILQTPAEENLAKPNIDPRHDSVGGSPEPSDPWKSARDQTPTALHSGRDKETLSCSQCGTCFTSQAALCKHMEAHEAERSSTHPDCWKEFSLEETLVQHRDIRSEKKAFPCPECGRRFTSRSQLIEHRRSHGVYERERFSCSECGKCFSTKAYLNIHRKNHLGLKPYECSECGKFFARKMYLSRHQVRHLGHKPFECPECGKCFFIKPDLQQHLKRHTGERPFSCSECGKCFTRKSGLHNHRTFHTGEHPYSCPECGKCFTRKSEVRRHLKLHAGERPFSCSECGKSFSRKTHLINHHRVHTGERPFPCSVCGKRFKCKRVLIKHETAHVPSTGNVSQTNLNIPDGSPA